MNHVLNRPQPIFHIRARDGKDKKNKDNNTKTFEDKSYGGLKKDLYL